WYALTLLVCSYSFIFFFFFSSRRRHTRCYRDWSSDVCSSDLPTFSIQPFRIPLRSLPVKLALALAPQHPFGVRHVVQPEHATRPISLAQSPEPDQFVDSLLDIRRSEEHTSELQSR